VYKPTNVISVSYSGGELDLPASYIKRQCDEFMKLGMQGVTTVMSSGDYGVGSYPGDFNLTTGCAGPKGTIFYPQTSSTCPYVLSVGSTVFERNPTTGSRCNLTEVATDRFASGGGFSNYFDVPAYQAAAVETYFATTPLSFSGYLEIGNNYSAVGNGVYKIGGRGYPDVSAIGDNFVFRSNGKWGLVGGTSLSAPVWASVLTRINEERLAAGKKTVGYVNPTFVSQFPRVL
jgi:tripeptidyl-peptidase I